MCGIAGIICLSGIDICELQAMSQSLHHRGPDDEGFCLIDRCGKIQPCSGVKGAQTPSAPGHILSFSNGNYIAGLAHCRLSIIDLSILGHQPMLWHGRYLIVYNGEIYNYIEIRQELISKGYEFQTETDTEVVLAAYLEWGNACVNKFVGMWAFVIYDATDKIFFISRDRFAIKPFYYFISAHVFVFASEIKALFQSKLVKKELCQPRLYEYLNFGKLNDPSHTLFENIFEIPAGCNAVYNLSARRLQIKQYYQITSNIDKITLSDSLAISRYEALFAESVRIHMRSDVDVGFCLSGGLDSSAIVAFSALCSPLKSLKTFTAAYRDSVVDESFYANKVINHFNGTNGFFIYPEADDLWAEMEQFLFFQDLPVSSTSVFAQWKVMQLAHSQGMKVLLDGQGADEVLGGYSYFPGIFLIELLMNCQFLSLIKESFLIKKNKSVNIFNEIARAGYYFLPSNIQIALRKNNRVGFSFLDSSFTNAYNYVAPFKDNRANYLETSLSSIKHGLVELLRYEDRNSMAFSIESRVPFLDHRLVEFSLSLENNKKLKNGWTKYILRKIIENKLPEGIVWRKDKKGFITPQGQWKKGLQHKLIQYLYDIKWPAYFNRNKIEFFIESELSQNTHLSEFWKLIFIIKWFEINKLT